MANEAVLFIEQSVPINFIVSDSTGIERGATLTLSDPMTVVQSSAHAGTDIIGGIAAGEKIANDGKTKIEVYRKGIFKVTASGSVTAGDLVGFSDTNLVFSLTAPQSITTSGARIAGIALETATDAETFLMELNILGALQVA